jgi:hypothetical protein
MGAIAWQLAASFYEMVQTRCRKFRDPGDVLTATNSYVEIGGRARAVNTRVF